MRDKQSVEDAPMEVSGGTTQLGVHCLAMVTLVPIGVRRSGGGKLEKCL